VILALTICVPIAFLFVAMTSENFVGFASPIFFVPVGMLVVLGVPLAVLAVAWTRRSRPTHTNRTEPILTQATDSDRSTNHTER
jgi:membrane protein implicated in regulation of membrane protease activity